MEKYCKYFQENLTSIYKTKIVSMEKDYRLHDKISSKTFPIKRVSRISVSIQTIVMDLIQVKKVELKILQKVLMSIERTTIRQSLT